MTYKTKIYALSLGFIVIVFIMFFFVYGRLQSRNTQLSTDVASQRKALEQLLQEQRSYELGKKDIESLKTRTVQPDDLFSRDTRLVKEIKTLENLSKANEVEMSLQITGTAKNAQKVKSFSQILSIPYSITIKGEFDKILAFLDSAENLSFVSPVKTINITAQEEGGVLTVVTADFYIKQ